MASECKISPRRGISSLRNHRAGPITNIEGTYENIAVFQLVEIAKVGHFRRQKVGSLRSHVPLPAPKAASHRHGQVSSITSH